MLKRTPVGFREAFKKLFTYFNWRIITLQYCDDLLLYVNMNWPQVYMCTLHLDPPPIVLPTPSLQVVTEHQLWILREAFLRQDVGREFQGTWSTHAQVSDLLMVR